MARRLGDEDKQKRLREIGGLPKDAFHVISSLQHALATVRRQRYALYADTVKVNGS